MTSTESQVRMQTELRVAITTEQGLKEGDGFAFLLSDLIIGISFQGD
jgi:hypothetical protein